MLNRLCIIVLLVLNFSTPVFAGDSQSENTKRSLTDATNTEIRQKEEAENLKKNVPTTEQERNTQEEEPSIYDDDHG